MLTFLLDTKIGHLLLGLLCMALIGAGMYWKGHNKGWDAATAHYKSVTDACMSANAQYAQTVADLKTANAAFANDAAASKARADAAVKQASDEAQASAKAVADAQAKLHTIEARHGDAHAAAVTRIPPAVYSAICADGVCEPADRTH
jgi:hypothetical protein